MARWWEPTRRGKKDRHVGIENKDGARGFPGTVENGFLKFIGLRLASGQEILSVVGVPTFSPYWYIRGQEPQTAVSDVGGPTERQTFLRVFPTYSKDVVVLSVCVPSVGSLSL